MISVDEAMRIHKLLIRKFGGSSGLRDREALISALSRPHLTFGDIELYPSPEEKAAALLESIITNHPFIDGNKRLGYVLMKITLLESKKDIMASQEELYKFILEVAMGKMDTGKITEWIYNRTKQNEP